jgi:hypothetical protein
MTGAAVVAQSLYGFKSSSSDSSLSFRDGRKFKSFLDRFVRFSEEMIAQLPENPPASQYTARASCPFLFLLPWRVPVQQLPLGC